MIVTFYSFKGGVGRSMAMVNVGEILADWGYRVILCDWDLEAPGLERYVVDERKGGNTSSELAGWLARPGLMDLLQDYKEMLAKPPDLTEPGQSRPEVPPTHTVVGNVTLRRPSSYAVPTGREKRRPGSLSLLTSGRRDGEHYHKYAEAVRSFDWNEFYEKWAGDAYVELFRLDMAGNLRESRKGAADVVLIDSRTGVTEQGGVCTHHLADLVVLLSAANDLNLDGSLWMARTLSDPRLAELRDGRPLQILAVPSRIEQTAQKEELVTFRRRFRREFRRYIPAAAGRPEAFVLGAEIPYMPFYSFTERVVAREPDSQREQKLYAAYQALAAGIVRCGAASGLLPQIDAQGRIARLSLPSFSEPAERPKGVLLLGYAAADQPMAEIVAEGLTAAGVQVWADFQSLRLGNAWQDEILHAIDACTGYVFLLGHGGIPPSLRAEIDYALKRQVQQPEFRIVPVLLPDADLRSLGPLASLYAVPLPPGLSPGTSESADLFTSLAAEISIPGADLPAIDEGIPPYLGLRPFEEPQARFFFGREAEARKLAGGLGQARWGGVRWLQIEGPSGVGKSSFVLAGLVPAVRRGWISGTSKSWTVAICRPGPDPIASLAAAFEGTGGLAPSEIQAQLGASEAGLRDLVRTATPQGGTCLLVIDQLDELFVLTGAPERAQLDALLATALQDPDLPFYLITTIRSDYIDQFQELPRLQGALDRGALRHQLRPLSEDALREAMTAPAKLAGLVFESGLVERILRDLRSGQQSPALLGVLLSRLWENRSGNLLTHEAYDRLGGLDGVIAESADHFFAGLPEDEQKRARALLLQLVSAQGAGQSVPREEALVAAGDGPKTEDVLRLLVAAQIVTIAGDRVKLAHDALISSWPRLGRWLEAERDALRRREELEISALAWRNAGEPEQGLPGGPQLAYFEPAPVRSKPAFRYLEAARRRQRRQRQLAWTAVAVAVTAVLIGGGLALSEQSRKTQSRDLAQRARATLRTDPAAGLQLAINAAQVSETSSARGVLKEAIQSARERTVLLHDGNLSLAVFAPDGLRVLTAGAGGASLWELDPPRRNAWFPVEGVVTSAAFTPDGRRVFTLSNEGVVAEWNAKSGLRGTTIDLSRYPTRPDQLLNLLEKSYTISRSYYPMLAALTPGGGSPSFSGDGALAATWDDRGVHLWDLHKRREVGRLPDQTGKITRLAFSQDGSRLAIVTSDSKVAVLSLSSDGGLLDLPQDLDQTEQVRLIALSPDGDLLVTVRGDALAPTLWESSTATPRAVLHGHEGGVLSTVFNPDGRVLATTSADGTARIWNVLTGQEIMVLRGHNGAVTGASFSPDGRQLVTVGTDNTARIWDLGERDALQEGSLSDLLQQATSRIPVVLDADGRMIPFDSVLSR